MKRLAGLLGAGLAALSLGACCRQPDAPIELKLTLSRGVWVSGEKPWYKLEARNVGCKAITVYDRFWKDQNRIAHNHAFRVGVQFRVVNELGEAEYIAAPMWGMHGEHRFWGNDCGGYFCQDKEDFSGISLKPGKSVAATPSRVMPPRPPKERTMDSRGDARRLPYAPKGWPPEAIAKLEEDWRRSIEDTMLMGNAEHPMDSRAALASAPKDYRILEGFHLAPGRYKLQAIFAPLGMEPTREAAPDGGRSRLIGSAQASDRGSDWEGLAKTLVFESNEIVFDVVPSTNSLLDKVKNDNPVLRRAIDEMRRRERERHGKVEELRRSSGNTVIPIGQSPSPKRIP